MSLLVVGADSMIGGALLRKWRAAGLPVIGTTRRKERVADNYVFLDLADRPEKWDLPDAVTTALIAGGVTKLEECHKDPTETSRINVERVLALVALLAKRNIFTLYLSTDKVYDGSILLPDETTKPRPATEYGRQRAEVERRLMGATGDVGVIRLNKVLPLSVPLFRAWKESLQSQKPITPFYDMVMAPIPLSFALLAIERVIQTKRNGILNLSGERDISYADAARIGARVIHANEALIHPISAHDARLAPGSIQPHTALAIDQLRDDLGLTPPDVAQTISDCFANTG